MEPLFNFLAKYKNLGVGEKLSKEAFINSVNSILGKTVLAASDVEVKDGTALLKVPAIVKSEIQLNKAKILEKAGSFVGPAFLIKRIK